MGKLFGWRCRRDIRCRAVVVGALVLSVFAGSVVTLAQSGSSATLLTPLVAAHTVTPSRSGDDSLSATVPLGTTDASEPSGLAPPGPAALPGYKESYTTDFTGSSLPAGWGVYEGKPGGDPGAQWAANHVVVANGLLHLNTWQDPAYGGEWVAGGLCQCAVANTYGAYFVRSRMTGAGPTQVELLWPTSGWPPEVDFDETFGGSTGSMATLHWDSTNNQIHNTNASVDMTQWHTWGVIWTPISIAYTLDGRIWAQVDISADIPQQPMTLDIQQQTWCGVAPGGPSPSSCPTTPQSTLVDWVAEYKPTETATGTPPTTTTSLGGVAKTFRVGPFARNSASLSLSIRAQIVNLAQQIDDSADLRIKLTGYSDPGVSRSRALALSRQRVASVDRFLNRRLLDLHVTGFKIELSWLGTSSSASGTSSGSAPGTTEGVLARIS